MPRQDLSTRKSHSHPACRPTEPLFSMPYAIAVGVRPAAWFKASTPTWQRCSRSADERSKDDRGDRPRSFGRADDQPNTLGVLAKVEVEEGAALPLPAHHFMHALPRLEHVDKLELEIAAIMMLEGVAIQRGELAEPCLQVLKSERAGNRR
jgi:hypothetical protein